MADPISRSYEVFLENPESPTSAAGRAAVAVAGTQAFYDWDEVNLRVPNYDYQALTPNGMLASAGLFAVKATRDGRLMATTHNEPTC